MDHRLRCAVVALAPVLACGGSSAGGKASGSAEFGMQGGAFDANAEVSADASSPGEPAPAPAEPAGPSDWVGSDPCGVPEDAPTEPGQSAVALESGQAPDSQYVGTPVATLPAFRMLSGGCSRVFLEMRGDVAVTENRAPGRLTFRLANVEVPVHTNQFDLPTEHFATPVGRVQLLPAEGGAELVIDLRAPTKSKATLRRSPRGVVLNVDFRPAQVAPAAAQMGGPPPTQGDDGE